MTDQKAVVSLSKDKVIAMVDTDSNIDLIKNHTQVKSMSEYGNGEIWKEIDLECIP